MSLRPEVVAMLRCPFCGLDVHVEKSILPAPDGGLQHGTLKCRACNFDYPVVDGIPIMMAPHESVDAKFETNALTMLEGPKVYEVTLALLAGEPIHALSLLFNPSKLDGNLLPPLELPLAREGGPVPADFQRVNYTSRRRACRPQPQQFPQLVKLQYFLC